MPREFEISELLKLSDRDKYATTVAAFEVIDMLELVDIPKKMGNRKPAVQALHALTEDLVQWDYINEETREALMESLRDDANGSGRSQLEAVFNKPAEDDPDAEGERQRASEIAAARDARMAAQGPLPEADAESDDDDSDDDDFNDDDSDDDEKASSEEEE